MGWREISVVCGRCASSRPRGAWAASCALALSTVAGAAVHGQEVATPGVRLSSPGNPGESMPRPLVEGASGLLALEPVEMGRPVLNRPYTAEGVVEFVQTLEDGNRIEQRLVSQIARDSRGRTRREQRSVAFGGVELGGALVIITDPQAGLYITLQQRGRWEHQTPARLRGCERRPRR
jgi:hypothetical protein